MTTPAAAQNSHSRASPYCILSLQAGETFREGRTCTTLDRLRLYQFLARFFFGTATEKEQQEINFEEFVLSRPDHLLWNKRIYEIDGIDIVDITIRYDRLKDDVVALEKSHSSLKGLTETFMQLSAKSGYRSRSKSIDEYYAYAPRAFDLIYNLCRTEIRKYYFKVPDTTPIRPRRQASWHSKS